MGFLWEAHLRRWPVRLVLCFTTDETFVLSADCWFVMPLYVPSPLRAVMVFLLQGYGTATGSTAASQTAPPYLTSASPPTLMLTCKSKRPGWPSVSLMGMFPFIQIRAVSECERGGQVWCFVTFLSSVIIISVVEAILLLTLIFLRTRILIAIALIQESSKWVAVSLSAAVTVKQTFVVTLALSETGCWCNQTNFRLTSCVFYHSTERSVTWCPLCSTLWSPLFSCWCVLPTGVPLLCILPFDPCVSVYCTLCCARFRSAVISTVQGVVLPKHTFVDTWPLRESPSTESWLWIPKATVRVSMALWPATPW